MTQKKQQKKMNNINFITKYEIPFIMKPYYDYPYKKFSLLKYDNIKYSTSNSSKLLNIGKGYDKKI